MPFTRAQATALLNKSEMRLFDDSRANAVRGFDKTALDGRITRTRTARDRARDLLKRQRAAARARGEGRDEGIAARTARKEALLVELLERFVQARRTAASAPARKAAARTATGKRAAAKHAAGEQPEAPKTARKAGAKKVAAKKVAAKKVAAKKVTAKKVRRATRRLTPEAALQSTRQLLEEKQERARTPQPWQALDPGVHQAAQPGYQSPQAASRAVDLHAAESRMASIQGSQSTRDRHNQGKRDHRGDTD